MFEAFIIFIFHIVFNDSEEKLYVDLQIRSTNPLVRLKVEVALLSRLQNYITDENDKAIIKGIKFIYKII